MSIYDPPTPPEPLHPCRWCDSEMEQDWPGVRGSDWICVNPECEHSPKYAPVDDDQNIDTANRR